MGHKSGFTLVEIMIVVAIIAILASIAIPQLLESRKMSKQNRCFNNLKVIDYAQQQYALNKGLASGTVLSGAQMLEGSAFVKNPAGAGCPSGGNITYDTIGVNASCDYHGTVANPTPLAALTAD